MNIAQKILLVSVLFINIPIFADDDVWFISPQHGEAIQGTSMKIQVSPPWNGKAKVRVRIKSDMGWERTVWRGSLTRKNNYTTMVDISKFPPGPYEIKAKYYIWLEDFDGELDFWIGNPNGQYYPPHMYRD